MRRALGGCVVGCALLVGGAPARANSALVGAGAATELRIAHAETGQWTTVWASFRLEGGAGPVGVVVPLPDGAFVDQSSDAWFEALEVATAPRVLPPGGLSPFCPGTTGADDPFEITASTGHTESLLPQSIAVVDGADGIVGWAAGQGLTIDAVLAAKLASTGAAKLMGVRFEAPGGAATTPTLRVTAPAGLPALPFSITRAGAADMRVTAWLFGPGRAGFTGTIAAAVPGNVIVWDAKAGASNYVETRDELLAGDPDRDALESAGHESLVDGVAAPDGTGAFEGVVEAYFTRASAYGNALPGAGACIGAAKAALGSSLVVGPVCPRGDLAALAGECSPEPPGSGELDGAALLCGEGADDLALAAAGSVPAELWVTRHVFVIPAGAAGKDRGVFNAAGPAKVPVVVAGSVDIGGCFGGAGGGSTSSSSGSGAGTTGTTTSSSGVGGTSTGPSTQPRNPGGRNPGGFGGAEPEDPGSDVYIDTSGCSCSPGPDTYDSGSHEGDDCDSGSSSGGDDCDSRSSSGGDDCDSGSSSGGDDCDSGSSAGGEDCDSGSGSGDSCSSDSGASDCSVGQQRPKAQRRRGPKLSAMMLAAVALLFPLRRRGTKRRRQEEA